MVPIRRVLHQAISGSHPDETEGKKSLNHSSISHPSSGRTMGEVGQRERERKRGRTTIIIIKKIFEKNPIK